MASKNVLVVGGGRMGSQIACEYALGGHQVTVASRTASTARERVARALEIALQASLADEGQVAEARRSIAFAESLDTPSGAPDIVVESIVEDEAAKGELLLDVARRWPDATIASNTSSLSITTLGRLAGAEDRVLGAHYWNPPLLMPLVEVVAGDNTNLSRVDLMTVTLRGLGKRPVLVARDVPGFVWNRLQFALLREAAWIVDNGVATSQAVDEIVRDGLARRWRYTGPFQTMALGGAETFRRVAANLFPVLSNEESLPEANHYLNFEPSELEELLSRRDNGLRRDLMQDRKELANEKATEP
jgi:3-hydroxybutyryl-CoA dehydrogenase